MSSWSVVGIVVGAAVALLGFLALVLGYLRARHRLQRGPAVAPVAPPERDDPSRRQIVQRGVIVLFAAAMAGVVASAVDYVWPDVTGNTGGRFRVGSPQAVRQRIAGGAGKPYYDLSGRFYLAEYPTADLAAARRVYGSLQVDSMELGVVALSQKCPHLGCAVKWCRSSGWFECPCHGSLYNPVGELQRGPAPRGLDRHPVRLVEGVLEVDTTTTYLGPPPGTSTTDQPATGPHCY